MITTGFGVAHFQTKPFWLVFRYAEIWFSLMVWKQKHVFFTFMLICWLDLLSTKDYHKCGVHSPFLDDFPRVSPWDFHWSSAPGARCGSWTQKTWRCWNVYLYVCNCVCMYVYIYYRYIYVCILYIYIIRRWIRMIYPEKTIFGEI
jgi:hypothetical protein